MERPDGGHVARRRECSGCQFTAADAAADRDAVAGQPFRYRTLEIEASRLDFSAPDGSREPADQSFPPIGSQER